MSIDWKNHITINPEIHQGEPYITGTQISVAMILNNLAHGMSLDEILNLHPQLKRESIQAVVAYATYKSSDEVWERLMNLRDEISKNWKNDKSAVETLSEMRR